MKVKSKLLAVLVAGAFAPLAAYATNGYAPHGVGVKAQGMAGVGIALPQDSLAAGTNPAGMALVGNRFDVGVTWFRPIRSAEIVGSGAPQELGGLDGTFDGSGKKNFFVPEFGYNRMINPNLAVGVSVFGNGGMNTQYNGGIALFNGATFPAKTGIDLAQLFVAPTVAFKVTPEHSIGLSLNLAYQRFKAEGLNNFVGADGTGENNITDKGYDSSTGWGARIGWVGQITPTFSVGATYATKTRMSKFDKYKGLFAEQGDFDIPENYGIGVAWKAMPALTVAFDIQQINFSKIRSVGNPLVFPAPGSFLGASNGAGFGWDDMTVYKLGVSYDVSPSLTLRAGYSYADQPIAPSQTVFNILAPATIEQHLTLGGTWKIDANSELSFAYMHAFKNQVNGSGSFNQLAPFFTPPESTPLPPGTPIPVEANIKMYQDSLGISYGMKF